jgi:DNA polymerase III delta prime subunit
MKYLSSRFDEYIAECEKKNIHSNMKPIFSSLQNNINKLSHLIFYGPPGIGKYTQSLMFIKKFSQSNLKYERKINIAFNQKKSFIFKLSDIHFEIDMELLGCNAKVLFNDIYNNILDIFNTSKTNNVFILCKNFHCIHNELLDIFYSYMQSLNHKNITLHYILITENISFIPNNILNRCQIISFKKPTKSTYNKHFKSILDNNNFHKFDNIKNIIHNIDSLNNIHSKITNKIIHNIDNYKDINYLQFRDIIYDIFIYKLDLNNCIFDILHHFILKDKINNDNILNILSKLYIFFKFYNNNYRPIYHLENYFYYLCTIIHDIH